MSLPNEYQAVDHDASISARRVIGEDTIVVTITVGGAAEARIMMRAEDFARMSEAVHAGA